MSFAVGVVVVAMSSPVHAPAATASLALPAVKAGDVSVAQYAVVGTPRPALRGRLPRDVTAYTSRVAGGLRVTLIRSVAEHHSNDAGRPVLKLGAASGFAVWGVSDALHRPVVHLPIGSVAAGADRASYCKRFAAGAKRIGGPALHGVTSRAAVTAACSLALRVKTNLKPFTKATGITVRGSHFVATLTPFPAPTGSGGPVATPTPKPVATTPTATATPAPSATAAPTVTATATSTPAPLPSRIGVSLFEYSLVPSKNPIAAGNDELTATNGGMDPHALAIRDSKGDTLAATDSIDPTKDDTIKLKLAPGDYTLYCPILDHEALGMKTTITVK